MKNLNWKAYIAEFIGTFVLVFAACGTAALSGGNLVASALAFGLVIVAMAYSIGRISGCHINPAVSIAMLVSKKMSLKDFVGYVLAQIVGGFLGGLTVFGISKWVMDANVTGPFPVGAACNAPIGGEANASGIVGALLVEIILTFIFVYVIMNVTDSKNETTQKSAGLIIGLTLTLVHLIGCNLTGTSVNPARSLATALTDVCLTGSTVALGNVWIFLVAPLIGGVVAAIVFKAMHNRKEAKASK